MGDWKEQLTKFANEADEIQKKELAVQAEGKLFMDKLMGFLKQSGLPENFTLAQVAMLGLSKAND